MNAAADADGASHKHAWNSKVSGMLVWIVYTPLQPDEAAKIYVTIIRLSIYKEEGIENG
ncbi:MAG: hypothetical protein V8S31_02125 [Lachnospiraceae bacterium]